MDPWDRCFSAVDFVFFTQTVRLPYPILHSFYMPAVRIVQFRRCPHLFFVSLDGSRETILWVTCCFSMQLFEGYLKKRVRGNVMEYYYLEEVLWIAAEKHIVVNFESQCCEPRYLFDGLFDLYDNGTIRCVR
jgi:hypothetical protein